jgi:hypothetical protein
VLVTEDTARGLGFHAHPITGRLGVSRRIIELTPDVMATARRLLMQYQLRAGDAVQFSWAAETQDPLLRHALLVD